MDADRPRPEQVIVGWLRSIHAIRTALARADLDAAAVDLLVQLGKWRYEVRECDGHPADEIDDVQELRHGLSPVGHPSSAALS